MYLKHFASNALKTSRQVLATVALFQFTVGASLAAPIPNQNSPDNSTTSPIKHVIVIIGENRSFDHVFATYVPRPGETVNNLLSEGIVKLDKNKNAIPGPNFDKAQQLAATDSTPDAFLLSPPKTEFPNNQLPAPLVGGPSSHRTFQTHALQAHRNRNAPRASRLLRNRKTDWPAITIRLSSSEAAVCRGKRRTPALRT